METNITMFGIPTSAYSNLPDKLQQSKHVGHSYEDVAETVQYLRERTDRQPKIGLVLGSGLGGMADMLEETEIFNYSDIPNFLISTVPGHVGRLIFGQLHGREVLCMQGRFHLYEGYYAWQVTLPIRVMAELGVTTLLVSNASGGLNPEYKVGDVMMIQSHINLPGLAGQGSLFGHKDEKLGPRFLAMSNSYDLDLIRLGWKVGHELNLLDCLKEGCYAMQSGPCFETVAESRMLKNMGADVTGMSTAPEVEVGHHCGLRVFAMSLVTNMCVMEYDSEELANLEEVLETSNMRSKDMMNFFSRMVQRIDI